MPRPEGVDLGTLNMMYGDEVKDENGETIGVKMPFSELAELPSFEEHMDILHKAQTEELERRAKLDGENQDSGKAQRRRVEAALMRSARENTE